jgi:hypothetical protein
MFARRQRLPNRRGSLTFDIENNGLKFTCTASRYADGTVGEVFIVNHKAGSAAGIMASDAAVVCSIALQYGVPLDVIRKALMRDTGAGERPTWCRAGSPCRRRRRRRMNELAEHRRRKALTQYDPDKGLKNIAVAEAAEKHFERAKDATQLYEAIEAKLREQADYIVWRDSVVKRGGDRKSNPRPRGFDLPKSDPGQDVADRWCKTLCRKDEADHTVVDEAKVAEALAEAHERCVRICEQRKPPPSGTQGTGEEEWYTPKLYVDLAREMLGRIDLDPASNDIAQQTVQAAAFFDRDADRLSKQWWGNVFLNPPYTDGLIAQFVEKLVEEIASGRVTEAIMLTNDCTDTTWFHLGAKHCSAICFTLGRIKFINQEGTKPNRTQGQAFFYFGNRALRFVASFKAIGLVVVPAPAPPTGGAP